MTIKDQEEEEDDDECNYYCEGRCRSGLKYDLLTLVSVSSLGFTSKWKIILKAQTRSLTNQSRYILDVSTKT